MARIVRKQFLITAEQNNRLKAHAAVTSVSEAELISRRHRPAAGAARGDARLEPPRSQFLG